MMIAACKSPNVFEPPPGKRADSPIGAATRRQCDRLCRARTGRSVAPAVWARGCRRRCWPGGTSLNSRLAGNLQQAIIHTPLISGTR